MGIKGHGKESFLVNVNLLIVAVTLLEQKAAFTLDTSYSEDVINATGGGTAPTNPNMISNVDNGAANNS